MLRTLLVSIALLAAATALAFGGRWGMSDGGLRFSASVVSPSGMSDGGLGLAPDGMSDGGLGLAPDGMSDGGL
jgi:hypothetical protein